MKKILILAMISCCAFLTGCGNDPWGNNNPDMEHIYYYGFQDWGNFKNDVTFEVNQGETVAIPTQFWSEFTRSYTPEVYYYATGYTDDTHTEMLTAGMDYQVVDASGNALTAAANGAYTMTWPNAKKGVKNIYIQALNGKKGAVRVYTFDPTKEISNTDVASTTIIKTDEYEVRAFSQNYYVTVYIQ